MATWSERIEAEVQRRIAEAAEAARREERDLCAQIAAETACRWCRDVVAANIRARSTADGPQAEPVGPTKCAYCKGKGKVRYYHGDFDTCPTCHGTGDCPTEEKP